MVEGQIADIDTVTVCHKNRALDRVAELADVTKPLVGAYHVDSGARDEFYVLAEQAVEMLDKMGDEGRDCLAPFAKRRNQYCLGVEAIVEVVAELPRLDHRAQITIGGRDQSNIN